MKEHAETLYKFGEMLDREVDKMVKKGTINPSDLEVAEKAICLSIKIQDHLSGNEMMEEEDEYASGYHMPRFSNSYGSNRRSYGNNQGGQSGYGSYGSYGNQGGQSGYGSYGNQGGQSGYRGESRGMSGHSIKDRMIARLESMYDEAQSDHERQMIHKEIERINASED